jgi:transcriptional regulator with XRE-family HTH domain
MTRGQRIEDLMLRTSPRMDVKELADAAEVSPQYIYDLLKDKAKNPSVKIISSIARKLDVTIDYLENGTETTDRVYYTEPAIFEKLPDDLKDFVVHEDSTPYITFAKQLTRYDIEEMLKNIKDSDMKFLLDGLRMGIEKNKKN